MNAISRTELQEQANRFAREITAFLQDQNAESHSPNAALHALETDRTQLTFQYAYTRFVAQRRPVKP
jgi:hypothetical protein